MRDYFKKSIWLLLLVSSIIVLISATYSSHKQKSDQEKTSHTIDTVRPNPVVIETTEAETSSNEDLAEPTWVYRENPFKEILSLNSDFVAWIDIPGTEVDYPILRGKDNRYYLNKNINREESKLGSIFMDYRNIGQFNDRHIAIYGHYVKNGSMFGSLHNYKSEAFFNEHSQINVQGLYETKTYTIFSAYIVSADDYIIDLDAGKEDYLSYLTSLAEASMYPRDIVLSSEKTLLTLTTCSYEIDNGRIIIHAIEN